MSFKHNAYETILIPQNHHCFVSDDANFCLSQSLRSPWSWRSQLYPCYAKQRARSSQESSIQASINGHVLSVVFTENLGQVAIDISTAAGATVDYNSIHTPNGVNFYIPNTGSYVVTFTLPNNDVYYGEFEVTD